MAGNGQGVQSQDIIKVSATSGFTPAPQARDHKVEVAKLIDVSTCIGCKACQVGCSEWNCGYCIAGCPFNIPRMNPDDNRVYKCTLCVDRVSVGQEPACVKTCPTGAIRFGSKEEMKLYAEQRVADLKSRGYENAGIYDPEGVGGTHVMYVLHHADKPELYSGLPKDPQIDLTVTVWKDILKPVAAVAMGGLALAEIGHYLAVGPNVEEDVEDHHHEFEEEDRKGGKDE